MGDGTDLFLLVTPCVGDRLEDLDEGGEAAAGVRREVGAGEERNALVVGERVEWPSALPAQGLERVHVELVHMRQLFTVDFDGHKVVVEYFRHGRIRKRFARHDMAPVARGVADRHQHRHVSGAGLFEGLRAPHVPVHWLVGV